MYGTVSTPIDLLGIRVGLRIPPSLPFPPFPLPCPHLPFPSLLHALLPPLPLEVGPLITARGCGERFSSPSGSGRSPAAKRYLVNFRLKGLDSHLIGI